MFFPRKITQLSENVRFCYEKSDNVLTSFWRQKQMADRRIGSHFCHPNRADAKLSSFVEYIGILLSNTRNLRVFSEIWYSVSLVTRSAEELRYFPSKWCRKIWMNKHFCTTWFQSWTKFREKKLSRKTLIEEIKPQLLEISEFDSRRKTMLVGFGHFLANQATYLRIISRQSSICVSFESITPSIWVLAEDFKAVVFKKNELK